jgi:uncharacterized protein YybS (DUF2232 family)
MEEVSKALSAYYQPADGAIVSAGMANEFSSASKTIGLSVTSQLVRGPVWCVILS